MVRGLKKPHFRSDQIFTLISLKSCDLHSFQIFTAPADGRQNMGRSTPSLPTTLRLNPNAPFPMQKQIHLSTKLFTPAPILRFTVGKYSQLPAAESPEVAILGRSNVGVTPPNPPVPLLPFFCFLPVFWVSRGCLIWCLRCRWGCGGCWAREVDC